MILAISFALSCSSERRPFFGRIRLQRRFASDIGWLDNTFVDSDKVLSCSVEMPLS